MADVQRHRVHVSPITGEASVVAHDDGGLVYNFDHEDAVRELEQRLATALTCIATVELWTDHAHIDSFRADGSTGGRSDDKKMVTAVAGVKATLAMYRKATENE